ncbi:MAG: hypothetical protein RI910_2228 [Verrucomicrobiota bacterium]|jgi:hypothetical protein
MKPLYRTAFQLERVEDPIGAVHEIAQVCLDWVFLHKGAPRKGILRPIELGKHAQDFPATSIGDGRKLETRYWKGSTERLWSLRLTHPDDKDPGIEWCVELTLECSPELAKFTCATSIARKSLEVGSLERKASQPAVVPMVIAKFGAKTGSLRLIDEPVILGPDPKESEELKAFLLHWSRYQFVVLISPWRDGRPMVDTKLWAKKLSTLAFVFVADSDEATRAFEAALGSKRLACWGGAIRVYRPGFDLTDDPFKHYYFLPPQTEQSLAKYGEVGLADLMVARLTQDASQQGHADFLFWSSWVEKVGQLRIHSLQQANHDDATLAKLYEEENVDLRGNLDQAQLALSQLLDEVNILKGWKEEAQRAHREIRDGASPAQALRDLPEVDSVAQAIAVAAEELKGELEFHLNSKSDPTTPFQSPTDVLYAFRWLASTFRRSKSGRLANIDLESHFAEYLPTWVYAPNQSEVTIGKNREWYEINYPLVPSQDRLMRMHLSCGKDRRPEKCIRIGFIWDAKRALVAVGFVGQHQRSGQS